MAHNKMEARANVGDGKVGWEKEKRNSSTWNKRQQSHNWYYFKISFPFCFLYSARREISSTTNPYKSNQKFYTQKISHEINTSPWQQLDKFSLWNVNKCFIPRAPSVKCVPNLAGCFYPSTLVCYVVDWLERSDESSSDDKSESVKKKNHKKNFCMHT